MKLDTYHEHWTGTEFMYYDGSPDLTMIFHRAVQWSQGTNDERELYAEAMEYVSLCMQLAQEHEKLRTALEDLQKQLRQHIKFDVRKHYSLMVADSAATKALAKGEK